MNAIAAANEPTAETTKYPTRVVGRLSPRRWQEGDQLPERGSMCLVSGANCDVESDQHRAYSWRRVVGYGENDSFICLETRGCWPTVERITNCWFAEIELPRAAAKPDAKVWTEELLREEAEKRGWYIREGMSATDANSDWRSRFDVTAYSTELCELLNNQARAQVPAETASDLIGLIIRDVCELDPADPESPETVSVHVEQLQQILEHHAIASKSDAWMHNELSAEVERLNAIINTPQSNDFWRAASIEAEHQRQRWGSDHDSGKTPADWFWLIGYLAGKALHAHAADNLVKAEHHAITTAGACENWCRAMFGNTNMRPGIEEPAAVAEQASA